MILHVTFNDLFTQLQFKQALMGTKHLRDDIVFIPISSRYCELKLVTFYSYSTRSVLKEIKSIGLHTQIWSKHRINGHTKSIYY